MFLDSKAFSERPFFIDFVEKGIILRDITLLLNIYSNYKTLDALCHLWSLWT